MSPDVEVLFKAHPYVRTLAAFLIYLRYGGNFKLSAEPNAPSPIDRTYQVADEFWSRMLRDVQEQAPETKTPPTDGRRSHYNTGGKNHCGIEGDWAVGDWNQVNCPGCLAMRQI